MGDIPQIDLVNGKLETLGYKPLTRPRYELIRYDKLLIHESNIRKQDVTGSMDDFSKLIGTILTRGIVQPLQVVEPNYVISGQRRLLAVKYIVETLGRDQYKMVPCLVFVNDRSKEEWLEISLILEDTHIKPSTGDVINAYRRIVERAGSQREAAKLLGVSQSAISYYLRGDSVQLLNDIVDKKTSKSDDKQEAILTGGDKSSGDKKSRSSRNTVIDSLNKRNDILTVLKLANIDYNSPNADRQLLEKVSDILYPLNSYVMDEFIRELRAGIPFSVLLDTVSDYNKEENVILLRVDDTLYSRLLDRARRDKIPLYSLIPDLLYEMFGGDVGD